MVSPWVAVLTSFHNTPIFGRIWATVAALTVYAALVADAAITVGVAFMLLDIVLELAGQGHRASDPV